MEKWFSLDNFTQFLETLAILIVGMSVFYKKLSSEIKKYGKDKNAVASHIEKQTRVDLEITEELKKVREMLEVDQVCVFEFHNGEHYANGREALKASCTYEVCRYGITSVKHQLQSIPLSVFSKELKDLFKNSMLVSNNTECIYDTYPSLSSMLQKFGVKSYYTRLIYNIQRQPIGFIAAYEYTPSDMKKINEKVIDRAAYFVEDKILSVSTI